MSQFSQIAVFGEVLFDCFPEGDAILGGAPFNVAWHLQAFGDQPRFLSRTGKDAYGQQIRRAMQDWQMDDHSLQLDALHPTGQVEVSIVDNEPSYDIKPDAAFDFIDTSRMPKLDANSLLYHGTLALRNPVSAASLESLVSSSQCKVFVDVNLREPWWNKQHCYQALEAADWVKLNHHEMKMLGFASADLRQDMTRLQSNFLLKQLIVTLGSEGVIVRSNEGNFIEMPAVKPDKFVDSVGAGDAFSAMYIHGLAADWPLEQIIERAQAFASRVIGERGALIRDRRFYQSLNL
ncbi:fructokinase [Methylophaga lonarensis MPL]|uniref:Fructokinase n=1 Tax=Methylophaga lonarensis MPL TaxID=1286106 RepID=M7NX94_9GAMM|nr:carbohydrate kinase [Methylophaga lonarensis]EMR13403.1 fructokinase [Methylophaga lonarensis MPL]